MLLGSSWVFVGCKDDPQNMNPFEPNGPGPDPLGLNGSYSNKILPRKVPQTFALFFVPRKDVGRLALTGSSAPGCSWGVLGDPGERPGVGAPGDTKRRCVVIGQKVQ